MDHLVLVSNDLLYETGFFMGARAAHWMARFGPEVWQDYLDASSSGTEAERMMHSPGHALLIRCVRTFVLPVLHNDVQVMEFYAGRNPILATRVDGYKLAWGPGQSRILTSKAVSLPKLTPKAVSVPNGLVVELTRQMTYPLKPAGFWPLRLRDRVDVRLLAVAWLDGGFTLHAQDGFGNMSADVSTRWHGQGGQLKQLLLAGDTNVALDWLEERI